MLITLVALGFVYRFNLLQFVDIVEKLNSLRDVKNLVLSYKMCKHKRRCLAEFTFQIFCKKRIQFYSTIFFIIFIILFLLLYFAQLNIVVI